MADEIMALWESPSGIIIPNDIVAIEAVNLYATQLTAREKNQVIVAYNNNFFDMSAEYVWNRAFKLLSDKVLSLGIEFVLEMLDVSDSRLINSISAQDIINLAFELGFIDNEGKLLLTQSYEQIQLYTSNNNGSEKTMKKHSAEMIINTCVQYILGPELSGLNLEFNNFRDQLKSDIFRENTPIYEMLLSSPYFYIRTTVKALTNLLHQTEGAEFQIVSSNIVILIPAIWDRLFSDDKYSIGNAYAVAVSKGNSPVMVTLKRLLSKVQGFDYVPENLRSNTFINVAQNIISTHYRANNFYNEPSAIRELVMLGNIIPKRALSKCVQATLLVKVGNCYGISWDAQEYADQILASIIPENWEFYFENYLVNDDTTLSTIINTSSQFERWCTILNQYQIHENPKYDPNVNKLIKASLENKYDRAKLYANAIIAQKNKGAVAS